MTNFYKMIIKEYYKSLVDVGYTPYALTMTFYRGCLNIDKGDEELFYSSSAKYNERNSRIIYNHAGWIEGQARKSFNTASCITIFPRKFVRKSSNALLPLFFYDFDVRKYSENRNESLRLKKGNNISPLHIHGIVMVPLNSKESWQRFVGEDTLLRNERGDKINGIFSSRVVECYDVNRWHDYSIKYTNESTGAWSYVCINSRFDWKFPSILAKDPEAFINKCVTAQWSAE
jgi:hypothetical protein